MRFAWLKKGYDALEGDPSFFGTPDAMVALGTGKNMVAAIRHWGLATGVWAEVGKSRGRELKHTDFGFGLLDGQDGWDPYLEDPGTIWWLHWQLVRNQHRATAWSWVFGRPRSNRFRRDEVVQELSDIAKERSLKRTSPATIKRDVDVLIRSYCKARAAKGSIPEDSLDSPFVLLGLIRRGTDRGSYELVQGPHPTLPWEIFHAALCDYCTAQWKEHGDKALAINIDELLYSPLSPGRTFRLSPESFLTRLLQSTQQATGCFQFDETAGLRQLMVYSEPPDALEVLSNYYETAAVAASPR